MQSSSLDVEENDYSLCYYEQYSVKPIHKKSEANQSSSILTSICLDNNEFLAPELSIVANHKHLGTSHEPPILESELFFQENENETGDFNFTKINESADDPVFFDNKNDYNCSKSELTLDELSDQKLEGNVKKGGQALNANGAEVESVKHKLTSLWNNVKYGWVSYLKKPAKISLENGPIYILGKKFNSNNQYERSISDNNKPGDSLPFDIIDANKLGSLNESYISIPASKPYSIPTNRPIQEAESPDKQAFSISSNEFVNVASSPPLSKTNKADFYMVDDLSTSINNNTNFKSCKAFSAADLLQLQYLNPQKTSLEQEIQSRLWFTYRKDFAALNGNLRYTSDCGWGCMLRSAQMLIGQGLLQHYFGKDWSLYNKFKSNEYNLYKEILSLFNDRESKSCPFGIHRLLEIADRKQIGNANLDNSISGSSNLSTGSKNGTNSENVSRVGSWFGPTSVCLLMKEALNESSANSILNPLKIYVAQDCTIYKQDVIDLCTEKKTIMESEISQFKPCILLVSVRLGGDELNEIYTPSLKMFLQMDMCIGLIGGKPKHSLYFIGYQGDKVIYLDPHYCQPATNIYSSSDQSIKTTSSFSSMTSSKNSYDDTTMSDYELFDNSTFHCENPSKTPFSKLDPSLAIGFLCSSLEDLNNLCDLVKKISSSDKIFPIFGVNDDGFEKSQLKYQMLCDEEVLTESLNNSLSFTIPQKQVTPAIPIKRKGVHLKSLSSPKSSSSSSAKSLGGLMQSLPQKLERLRFENNEKRIAQASSPKKSPGSFLSEKFTRPKQNKKKSESEDFVLV